jgi:host factor-I protein
MWDCAPIKARCLHFDWEASIFTLRLIAKCAVSGAQIRLSRRVSVRLLSGPPPRTALLLLPASKIDTMSPLWSPRPRSKTPPPGETGQEALYLRSLSERQVQVCVKLRSGEQVSGWIEYFDDGMIRLTREGKPNLFIYKTQILAITEAARRPARTNGKAANESEA